MTIKNGLAFIILFLSVLITDVVKAQNPNPPAPYLRFSNSDNAIFAGESADLYVLNYNSDYKYQWYKRSGQNEILQNGGADIWFLTITDPGVYVVYAIDRQDPQNKSFDQITITGKGAVPAPIITSNQPNNRLQRGQWGTMTITNYDPRFTYHWYIGNDWQTGNYIQEGLNLQTIGMNRGGTFTVYAIFAGQTVPGQIYIDEMPEIPIITASQTNLCNGAQATLSIANYDAKYDYHWYKGTDFSTGQGLGQGIQIQVNTAGNYICYAIDKVETWKHSISNSISITTGSAPGPLAIAPATSTLPVATSKITLMAAYSDVTWYKNGQPAGTGLTIETDQPGNYTAQSSSSCGSVTSNTIAITKVNGLLYVSTNTYLPLVAESSATGSLTFTDGFTIPAGSNYRAYAIQDPPPPLPTGIPQLSLGNENYILTYSARKEGVTDVNNLDNEKIVDVNRDIQYFDGLGRPMQNVQIMGSALQKDVIQPIAYDIFGRETVKYLPYAGSFGNGSYHPAAHTSEVFGFYNAPPQGVVTTAYPIAETKFEPSPLNRVIEQGAPGASWQVGQGHTVTTAYGTITDTEVRNWVITTNGADGSVRYPENQLYKTTVSDENQNATIEYKDKEGRIVAKRVEPLTNTFLTTFYVYDDFGNLKYVIAPGMAATSFTEGNSNFNNYVYAYRYDERNRLIEKKIPGKEWEYMVYNKQDQVVATQNGQDRGRNEWNITKYDALGRVVMTGLWNNNNVAVSRADLQAAVYAAPQFEARASNSIGYTTNTYPNVALNPYYTINYYDDYNFTNTAIPPAYGFSTASTMTRGLLTGTKTNVLQTGNTLLSVLYYDNEGRNIKTFKQHYLGSVFDTNNYDEISNTYNFSDELTSSTRRHYAAVGTAAVLKVTVTTDYEYDHMGRKTRTWEKVDNDTRILLAQNNYNEVGQLKGKQLHSEDTGTNFLQSVNYGYNERGWLKESIAPLFAMQLKYQDGTGTTPQWNGNITNQYWGTSANPTQFNYTYSYDKLNRLTSGVSAGGTNAGYNEQGIDYDNMGNILHLTRYQANTNLGTSTYTYSGNRLNSISGLNSGTYSYDGDGNMTYDSKNGVNFAYHKTGALKSAIGGTKNIRYIYDAVGNKLGRTGSAVGDYDYIDGIEYRNDAIESIQTEEGRIFKNGSPYSYEYALKDHLGNSRVFFDKSNGIAREIQKANYYPFGLVSTSSSIGTENKYLYNGKELQDELKYFDYGARMYDPLIGRWTSVDPKAESYLEFSTYNYVFNNPIRFVDPDGKGPDDPNWLKELFAFFGITTRPPSSAQDAQVYSERRQALQSLNRDLNRRMESAQETADWIPFLGAGMRLSNGIVNDNKTQFAIGFGMGIMDSFGGKLLGNAGRAVSGAGKEVLEGIFKKSANIAGDHLTTKDITGAVRDIFGDPVIINGKQYDHLGEVKDALKGIGNQIEKLNKGLGKGEFTDDVAKQAEQLRSTLQKEKDRIQNILLKAENGANN